MFLLASLIVMLNWGMQPHPTHVYEDELTPVRVLQPTREDVQPAVHGYRIQRTHTWNQGSAPVLQQAGAIGNTNLEVR